MIFHPVFPQHYNSLIRMIRKWNKYSTFYFTFPLQNHWFNIKEGTRYIAYNYFSTFVIFKSVTYIGSYSSIKDKYPILYVSSSYLSTTLKFSDLNDYEVEKYPTFYVIFPLGNHWFNIKSFTRDISYKYFSIFVFQFFWFLKQRSKI